MRADVGVKTTAIRTALLLAGLSGYGLSMALFVRAGQADVNLEDVRIEHTLGRLRAIAHLVVRPHSEQRLRESLTAGGWRLRG